MVYKQIMYMIAILQQPRRRQTLDRNLSARLDALMKRGIDEGVFPGGVAMVSQKGEVLYNGVFGHSMVTPEKRAMHADSIFDLASLTKVVATTTAVLQLIEQGRLSLSDRVCEHFKEYTWTDGNSRATVEDLMAHTSGFAAVYPFQKTARDPQDVVRVISTLHSSLQTMYEPGSGEVYSDLDYILLGRIVEKVSGKSLDVYCGENIYRPLGMSDTCFKPDPGMDKRLVATEVYPDRLCLGTVHDENAYFMGGISGHAGLFSTALDLKTFSDALLNRGVLGGTRILSGPSIAQMVRQRRPDINGTYGLGWQLNTGRNIGPFGDLFPVGSFGHTGFTGTMIWMDLPTGISSILLTNRVHPSRSNGGIVQFRQQFNNIVAAGLL